MSGKVSSGLGNSTMEGSSLSDHFPCPSMKITFQDLSLFLSMSTTTYMESPSNPIRLHSFALSSNFDRALSGTLMKHFEPNTKIIDGRRSTKDSLKWSDVVREDAGRAPIAYIDVSQYCLTPEVPS